MMASVDKAVPRSGRMASMKRRSVQPEQIAWEIAHHNEPQRHDPILVAWHESQPASVQQELTIGQFLGREVLGKDPMTPAKDFLWNEVQKAVDNSGVVRSTKNDSKRTFQLLAGTFEFKRVNYKN